MSILSPELETVTLLKDICTIESEDYDYDGAWKISEENSHKNRRMIFRKDCDKLAWRKKMTPEEHISAIVEELGNFVVVDEDKWDIEGNVIKMCALVAEHLLNNGKRFISRVKVRESDERKVIIKVHVRVCRGTSLVRVASFIVSKKP